MSSIYTNLVTEKKMLYSMTTWCSQDVYRRFLGIQFSMD